MRATLFFAPLLIALLACREPASAPEAEGPGDVVETVPGTELAIDMVWVPEGRFWIGRTEVPWDLYLAFCDFDASLEEADGRSRPSKPLDTHPYDRGFGTEDRPAVGMSHQAARDFCAWLSERTGHTYRLPTRTEWQLALAGEAGPTAATAWTADNSEGRTGKIATRAPNTLGIHDLYGNLWEYLLEPEDPESDWPVPLLVGGSYRESRDAVDADTLLRFDEDWTLADPNYPPGRWWIPDGPHLGFRLLRPGPSGEEGPR